MSEEKKTKKEKIKKSFKNQQFKSGAYSSLITVIVFALVIVVNLVFGKLDLSTDLSSDKIYTLSKDTKSVCKNLKDDITIYYMISEGKEETHIKRVVDQYEKMGKHIKTVKKDPVVYPKFAKQFVDNDIADNDIIVVNDKTKAAKYVSVDDMYYTQNYSFYGQGDNYLDAEGRITSAIQNVTTQNEQKLYVTTGHGEQELSDSMSKALEKMNVTSKNAELVTAKEMPSDCGLLLMYGPTKDIRDSEKNVILDYLKNGGKAIILPSYTGKSMPNIEEIIKYYGISLQKGIIYEGANHYETYLNWIVPDINTSADLFKDMDDNAYVIMADAQGLLQEKESNLRTSLKITNLLTTSKKSLLKTNPSSGTTEKEKGDLDGPFVTGVYIEDTINNEKATDIAIYSTGQVQESLLQTTISNMMGSDEGTGKAVSIEAKSLSSSTITMGVGSQIFWTVLLVFLVPIILLVTGFVIWITRRRK